MCIQYGGIVGMMFVEFPPNLIQHLFASLLAKFSLQRVARYVQKSAILILEDKANADF